MGSCRVENTETKEENCRLDYPALSCNDVSAWTSTVVARERHLGPRRGNRGGANWSHEGLTTEGKVKKIPSSRN